MKTYLGLMNSVYSRVSYAPPDLATGVDGDGDGDGDLELDDTSIPDSDDDEGDGAGKDKKKINDDPGSFMSDLLGAGDDESDDDAGESPEEMAAAEKALATELQTSLAGLTLPQDIIPEDFDASDPAKLHKLLQDVQINAATNAVKLVLKPVQVTLTRMATQLRREARDAVRDGIGGDSAQRALVEAIPGAKDPRFSATIKTIFEQSRKKHPKDINAALSATKKALSILGVQANDDSDSGDDSASGIREGRSALDAFGLRLPPPQSRNAGRMRR